MSETITIYIDDEPVEVAPGTNLIEAAAQVGKEIPHYCYHPKLSVVGNCRMCLIEMGTPLRDRATGQPILDEKGEPKIGWVPRPVIACATQASPGLRMKTDSPMVRDCRNGVMEFLLINHPLDCPICDQAGECRLQEFATDYGRGYSRFVEEKVHKPKRTVLGPRVLLDDERCILCSRCIRFMQEIAGDDVLGFTDRGSYSTLTCYPGKQLESNYSLNTVDICPVGALTSRDFRFKMRVWFLKPVNSICTESSVGANTQVWQREGKVYRITPRRNDSVNDTWMADSGRALYKQIEADDRLTRPRVGDHEASPDEAVRQAVEVIRQGGLAYVVNGHLSVEEQFQLAQLRELTGGDVHQVAHTGEGDGILISADRTPNVRGALYTGLSHELPSADLKALGQAIDAGQVSTLVVCREDVLAHGLTPAQLEKVDLVYIGTHQDATAEAADVLIPSLTVFEKEGTFINQQFRLQKFRAVVPAPAGTVDDLHALAAIRGFLEGQPSVTPPTRTSLWKTMATAVPEFEGIIWNAIPDGGLALVYSRFLDLPFVEGKTLKYDPEAFLASEAVSA